MLIKVICTARVLNKAELSFYTSQLELAIEALGDSELGICTECFSIRALDQYDELSCDCDWDLDENGR